MKNVTFVLDINGVLADVRKKSAPRVPYDPDLTIPSGQAVYMRPRVSLFCERLSDIVENHPEIKVVVWTSRLKANAEPIERYLRDRYGLEAQAYLHGEDCRSYCGYHPQKSAAVLRELVPEAGHVVFVDDSPKRLALDPDSEAIEVPTYDALRHEPFGEALSATLSKIRFIIQKTE